MLAANRPDTVIVSTDVVGASCADYAIAAEQIDSHIKLMINDPCIYLWTMME